MPGKIPIVEFNPRWIAATLSELARLRRIDGPEFVSVLSWEIAAKARDRLLLMNGGSDMRFHLVNTAILAVAAIDPRNPSEAPSVERLLALADEVTIEKDGGSDPVRAHREALFPRGEEDIDLDLRDVIVRLDSKRAEGVSDAEIMREFFANSNDPNDMANKMAARIRKLRQQGRTTLPPRAR